MIKTIIALTALLFSTSAYSHTGVHTELFHPMSGVDHFLVILAIGVVSGLAFYFHKK
ncbi:MAG: HupE/UreJ family protein [Gammaproteobacteria bacterium]|nr:HupE/UreJ family protein [Gammaproteobacteria bacterium]